MNKKYEEVRLRKGREISVEWRHPWIFSGAVTHETTPALKVQQIVRVVSNNGKSLGIGYTGQGSIGVKLLSFKDEQINEDFWIHRIERARNIRKELLLPSENTNAYRLLFGEADDVPGVFIDVFDRSIVVQFHAEILYSMREALAAALVKCFSPSSIFFLRSFSTHDSDKRIEKNVELYLGSSEEIRVKENGLTFFVDCLGGQKTGFYLDQRESRLVLRKYSQGRNILNAFSYSGGFTVNAFCGGASRVTSIDSSQPALVLLEKNIRENFADCGHEVMCEDVFSYLENSKDQFDLIVVDPPAFAKHKRAVDSALRGYRGLNALALRRLRANGMLFSFSCSQLISANDFKRTLFEAACDVGCGLRIVHQLTQASCHPVSVFFPESEYLKGFVCLKG